MENLPPSVIAAENPEQPFSETAFTYPPKFRKPEEKGNVWLKSAMSLALYLVLGYYIFPSYKMLLIITAIVVFHELGHFFAMKMYRYTELGIFFIPLLGAYVSGSKREVSQKQSAVILLAGPLPGIILGVVFYLIDRQSTEGYYPFDVSLTRIALLMIILNLINLLPVYPLDGGQLLNRIFLDEESWISKGFVILSAALMCYIAWRLDFYVLLIFPVMMLLRLKGDHQFDDIEKKIEDAGINADVAYGDMPDADYWKIRNIVIENHPPFRDVPLAPPYNYDKKEEKIMTTIQGLLHRHLIQDVSIVGKCFLVLIWLAAFGVPWFLQLDMSVFHRFIF